MDSATLVFVAMVLLVQIIILVFVIGTRNSLAKIEKKLESQPVRPIEARPERPDFRSRRNEAPIRQDRPRPVEKVAPAPVASVDKSLRDINLRLKSAERDQEAARKEAKPSGPDGAPRRSDRDNRGGQRSSYGQQPRRDDRPPRDFARKPDSENRPAPMPVAPAAAEPVVKDNPVAPVYQEPRKPVVSQIPVNAPVADDASADFSHGRKVVVKRRSLSADESAPVESTPIVDATSEASAVVDQPPVSTEPTEFGRR